MSAAWWQQGLLRVYVRWCGLGGDDRDCDHWSIGYEDCNGDEMGNGRK